MTNTERLIDLIKNNPSLPVVPMVDEEIVGDDSYRWWLGSWGRCEVTRYYRGRESIHFSDDDEENILCDMVGCEYYKTKDGRDITDLSEKEWEDTLASLEWAEAIVVYITA